MSQSNGPTQNPFNNQNPLNDPYRQQLNQFLYYQQLWGSSLANVLGSRPVNAVQVEIKPLPKITVAGPMIAYRGWNIGCGKLLSTGIGNMAYPLIPIKAVCKSWQAEAKHSSPESGCTCGWYSVKELSAVPDGDINGKVAIWGKIIAHKNGYRSEYCHPLELYVPIPMMGFKIPRAMQEELDQIYKNYGCTINISVETGRK